MLRKVSLLAAVAALVGCAPTPPMVNERLGQFTAASSFNIRNLVYEHTTGTAAHVVGKSCYKVNKYTLQYLEGPKDDRLQRAMDDAIRTGQSKGIEGDLLVNVRIENRSEMRAQNPESAWSIEDRYECIYVDGDLVKVL